MTDEFAFKWRVIEPWHEPDGATYFAHGGNIFTWKDMLDTKPTSPLGRWVTQVREWGFNAMSILSDPEANPEALRAFGRHLKANGIGLIIPRYWCETEHGHPQSVMMDHPRPRTSEKLCPYSGAVRAYWADRIARDFAMIPDLVGYRTTGNEFYYVNGAPWMCDCRACRTKSPRERTREAIRLLAGLLAPYGGSLFWETCQDDPCGQRHELHYFRDLTSEIPPNAQILIKRFYWDYHPGWPRHPLYDVIVKDAQGRSPYMTSFQEPGEYRGVHDFPWCMVEEWSQGFRDMVITGQQGVWIGALVHPDGWDHPLNMVNWEAVARYLRDPRADPFALKLEWARERFGVQAAPVVVAVLDRVTEAARGMYEFDALWTGNHSRFPTLEYLDSHLCGPYRQVRRMTGMIGLVLPLDMYPPQRQAEIRADRRTRLLFNQVPITPQLKAEAMAQKQGAVRRMEETLTLWRSLAGKVEEGIYHKVLAGLAGNLVDTMVFRHMMDLYMDWKLGVLTEAKIDTILAACKGMRGTVVPNALDPNPRLIADVEPASLKTFSEQLRRELREPWIERFWREHPLGVGLVATEDSAALG